MILVDLPVDKVGLELERGAEETFTWNEQHHELRRGLECFNTISSRAASYARGCCARARQPWHGVRLRGCLERLQIASIGVLASHDELLLPGNLTTTSGRNAPSSVETWACSTKSQCSSIPASSTTRRVAIRPRRPRTRGDHKRLDQIGRLALQRHLGVGSPRTCWVSPP